MSTKRPCSSCQTILQDELDISRHPSLMTVYSKELNSDASQYVFFCKECQSLLSMEFSMESPMDDQLSLFKGHMTDEFVEYFSLALWAENRREQMQLRCDFLKERLVPIYEPIDEKEWDRMGREEDLSKVSRLPSVEWHDNVEDALNSMEYEEEWDESYSFSYAEPIDLEMISGKAKIPRFYRTYLVRADEVEPMLRIEANEPSRLCMWKQTVSCIQKISVWDELSGANISMEQFQKDFKEEDLWMEPNLDLMEKSLHPYKEWITNEYTNYVVS